MGHELNTADKEILDKLHEGRNLPQNIARDLGYSRQYIYNRLRTLQEKGYVENIGGGLYELQQDPREDET